MIALGAGESACDIYDARSAEYWQCRYNGADALVSDWRQMTFIGVPAAFVVGMLAGLGLGYMLGKRR